MKKHALLIAASEFPSSDGEIGDIPGALEDACALREVLESDDFGAFSTAEVLQDLPHYEVELHLNKLFRHVERDDLVLIYYTGHGLLDPAGKLYLAASNTLGDYLPATAIETKSILRLVRESRATRVVMILDCCYSGAITDRAGLRELKGTDDRLAIGVITASSSSSIAHSDPTSGRGALSRAIVEALRGGDADYNGDGIITAEELYRYIKTSPSALAGQRPMFFHSGTSSSLAIAKSPKGSASSLLEAVRVHLRSSQAASLPRFIRERLRELLRLPVDQVATEYGSLFGLLREWVEGALSDEKFIGQWYVLDKTGLPVAARDNTLVARRLRWDRSRACRDLAIDEVGPAYILDKNYHLLDWNPAFDELLAKELGLVRGQHVEDFILRLHNRNDVVRRSRREFGATPPLIDIEPIELMSKRFGLVKFTKIASQLPDAQGQPLGWCVHLNITEADKASRLWSELKRRLSEESHWTNYARAYDKLLLNFDAYRVLVSKTCRHLRDCKYIADLGAGTGNAMGELIGADPVRSVWAFESNEAMLEHLHEKLERRPPVEQRRVAVIKGDALSSLREFDDATFDGALSLNSYYALPDKVRYLSELYRVMESGGRLVIATPTAETADVRKLFDRIEEDLKHKGIFRELRPAFRSALERNLEMVDRIGSETLPGICENLAAAGFEVDRKIERAYHDTVVIISARKPKLTNELERTSPKPASSGPTPRVFISYAREESSWMERLVRYLTPAERSGRIELWNDKRIALGANWENEIEQRLRWCTHAILLVSPAFLASEYIVSRELPRLLHNAKSRGVTIMPVVIESGLVDEPIPYRTEEGERDELTLTEFEMAATPNAPLKELEPHQQNMVFTKIARRLIDGK